MAMPAAAAMACVGDLSLTVIWHPLGVCFGSDFTNGFITLQQGGKKRILLLSFGLASVGLALESHGVGSLNEAHTPICPCESLCCPNQLLHFAWAASPLLARFACPIVNHAPAWCM